MRPHRTSFSVILGITLITLFAFSSCSKKNASINPEFSQYISAFTYGNISPESYIQVELTQELPAVELNAEVSEKLFSFSPALKGKTVWINNNTLRFTPDAGALKPGKTYKVKFHLSKVLQVDSKFKTFQFPVRVNEQNFTAAVYPYSPVSITDLTKNTVEMELNLANGATVEDVTAMVDKGNLPKEVTVRVVQEHNTNNRYRVFLENIPRTGTPGKYEIKVNGSAVGADKNQKFTIEIPPLSKDHFSVVDVRLDQRTSPHLRITLSDPLAQGQDIQGLIVPEGVQNFTFQIDKNMIRLYPEVVPDKEINLKINSGLRSHDGLNLDKSYNYQLAVESDKPEIKVDTYGNILPNAEQLILPFSAVNLWAVDVRVIKVYRNNILYYLQSNSLGNDYQNEIRRFGRVIIQKQIRLDTDKSLNLSQWNFFSIDLSTLFKQDPGAMYIVQLDMKQEYSLYRCGGIKPQVPSNTSMRDFNQLSDEEQARWDVPESDYYDDFDWYNYNWEERDDPCKASYYMNNNRRVQSVVMASNLGIIAKGSSDGRMFVAVTDILTTKPVSGAEVTIYNYQMQPVGNGKTDGDGFVEMETGNTRPFVLKVEKGKDTGYLEVKEEASLSLSNFDVSGKEIQKGLKGYLYGERGVWRPGDTIYLTFILEDKTQKLPKGHPVSLEVFTPKRQFYLRQVKTDSQNGFYTFAIPTDPMAETGTWQAYVKVGGTSFYKGLRIETIKPNRLKIRFETDSIIHANKGAISGTLNSGWLHGSPASNLKADVELTLSKIDNPFKGYTDYIFNNPLVKFETASYKVFDGVLNSAGVAGVNAKVPLAEMAPGMLRGSLLSRVFETGGDMSFYTQTVFYSPFETYVGIKSPTERNGQFLETDKPITFDVVTLNPYGQKTGKANLSYRIFKLEWSWWWNSTQEDLGSYVNNTAVKPIDKGNVPIKNGAGKINFQVEYPEWGRYLLIVADENGHMTGTIFYVDWPSSRGRSNKTDPSGVTMLSFSTDKQTYSVGETAAVFIPKSSNGRALVSIENGTGIIRREWIHVSEKEDTKYTFRITEEMNPNCYVFVTLLQPHQQAVNGLPIRMYGVVNLNIENKDSKLTPVITMPDELRPEKEFTVSVSEKSRKPMSYTLAIVDEGLLDLTAFKTPNAWNEFYSREALGVRTWDLFDRVLGANTGRIGPLLSIGGDEALKASSDRVNRFKPVVKFIGPFTLQGGETKSHKIKLPAYVGSVRVMVVAGGNGAYGSAEKTVAVRNALMTLSTLPRVLGPNEEVYLPVNVFAMDNKVKNVNVSVQTKGMLQATDGTSKSVSFDKQGDNIVYFKLKAGKKTGEEQITIKASGSGESFTETINIGIRNPNPPVIVSQTALIDAEKSAELAVKMENIGEYDWVKLELSRLPSIHFNKNLNFLVNYPHACSEQVTSQGFPLLYINGFTTPTEDEKKLYSEKMAEVIRVLSSRQLPDGGFMYWAGNSYASEWTSSYVGHFLTEAKNKGYEVSDYVLNRWVDFQQKLARNWTPTNPQRHYYSMSMTQLQQAYRLYTLALAEKTEIGAMNRLREMKDLNLQARWQLASAYALAGKKDVANELIFNASTQVPDYSFNNDTYGSAARDQAMMMDTYLLLGQTEKAIGLANSVAQALSSEYVSTQTASFGLSAMGKLAKKMGKGNIDVKWSLNGKFMTAVNTPQPFHTVGLNPAENLSAGITNQGRAKVYARLTAQTQPLEITDEQPVQGSFLLSVRYTDVTGNPIDVKSLKQGTEFRALVTVENSPEQAFTDLALVHVFPSGWEIFNERLINGNSSGQETYNFKDIRDDRVLTYFNLAAGQKKSFSVRLQAAYRGKFYLPPASCQAMYAPQEQARTVGGWVEVKAP